ncbi:MAG: RagB/SusD family nutrient uptake outer membrane protein [Bacteroidales bacterium]|nr:RagB/SusD family nutrient uptake outer membrane protein [Bacteroidales bacterium]MBR0037162.1 RagB/SusD family nutrient uptake outer membrane protein [Bacteroidales bacterium]
MKRTTKYIGTSLLCSIICASLASCDDLFEPAPENNLGVDYMYKNPQYAEGVLANAYTYLVCDGYSFSEMATDDAVCNQPSNGYRSMAAGTWTASNNPMNVWETCYNKIMYLNIFLNRCDRVDWADDPIAAQMYRDREKGEAYGLRAMNMFHLLQAHAGYDENGVLCGVPIILNEMDATSQFDLSRATFDECIQQIYADCDSALALLPMTYGDIENDSDVPVKYASLAPTASQYTRVFGTKFNGRMVGRIVLAYRARTALLAASPAYNQGRTDLWETAADAAGRLLDEIGGISGMDSQGWTWYNNTSEINSLANGMNPKEILWRGAKITGRKANDGTLEAQCYPPSIYGQGLVNPTQNFVDCFPDDKGYPISESSRYDETRPYTNRDPRLEAYVLLNGGRIGSSNATIITASDGANQDALNRLSGNSTRTGYYLRKLLNQRANLNPANPGNIAFYRAYIRYTEIFLDYAEAANEAWGPTIAGTHGYSAYDVIRALHNRCKAGNDYLESIKEDQEKMRQLIRNERRIELSFEGHRFWDLRRWQLNLNETAKGMNISQADNTYTPIDVDSRNYKEYQYYGPIPYSECLKYKRLKQNKGW